MATTILSTDALDIALGADGDLDLSRGGPRLCSGTEAVAQLVQIAILTVTGEWFLDLDRGIPWFEGGGVDPADAIMGEQGFDAGRARVAISDAITGVPGVAGIVSMILDLDAATRVLTVTWQVLATFGDVVSSTTTRVL